ncbi:MAG: TlpA family protein disulfide reductase [Bacteroidaceae bacterium]|nr:TlpA family protein disulfide reductase [Bacteroidaceae bacterium]
MRKKKFFITLFVMLLCFTTSWAQKPAVWDNPTTEFGTSYGDGFFNTVIDVTRVELKKDETTMAVRVQLRSDYTDPCFMFTKDTYLLADGVRYPVVSADGIEFDKFRQTEADCKLDIVFHFKPLPLATKVFDFIEGDGERAFQIKGIRPVEERHKMLFPSYWRNEKTGDWEIAFIGNYAIYDCKIWNMKAEANSTNGEAQIVLESDGKTVNVMVGKDKKGKRTITIDGNKAVYSMITERFMPYYPSKDTRTDFVDTNYKTDTATVIGWIKDMPEHYRSINTFDFINEDFFQDKQVYFNAELDSLGRFSIKIPLMNSSEFFCDWKRCFMRTMLEPGKTYFLLYDFKEGRRMWMGEDVRLQNELFRHPLNWKSIRMEEDGGDFDKYIASVDSFIKTQHAQVDELCRQHPTLSTRFNLYSKESTTWQQARDFGQVRFLTKDFYFPENAKKYAYENFWLKLPKPYTLYRDVRPFWTDYLGDAIRNVQNTYSFNISDHIDEITSDAKERDMLKEYNVRVDKIVKEIDAIPDVEGKQQIANEFNAANKDLIEQVERIFNTPRARDVATNNLLLSRWQNHLSALDSIGADKLVKGIWMTKLAYDELDHNRKPLTATAMDSLKVWIDSPEVFADLERKNEYYQALSNRQFNKLKLNTGKDLQGIREGEEILKKLLEPYRGKIVLIDVWGTWCGPCKEALSHSEEEYARLAKYDMQFVYLANNSPMDEWENVIKEYNVTGDNVTHFNLEIPQQSAIERYLQVTAFPTYKIVDPQGNILDIKVDARDLDSLEGLVKLILGK